MSRVPQKYVSSADPFEVETVYDDQAQSASFSSVSLGDGEHGWSVTGWPYAQSYVHKADGTTELVSFDEEDE